MINKEVRYTDDQIREAAKSRVAHLFHITTGKVVLDSTFDNLLKDGQVSDWQYNEFDKLLHDIRDVSDQRTLEMLDSGTLVIHTVGEYCEYMVRCYRTKPKDVVRILFARRLN